MFLNEKRGGMIKGSTCADGWKQRNGSQGKDKTPPKTGAGFFSIISAINMHEIRHVAVVDIPGALLTTYMDEKVIMVLRGRPTELMAKTEPSIYQKIVTIEKGWTVLQYTR